MSLKVIILVALLAMVEGSSPHVKLTSTAPAILDSKIIFTAILEDPGTFPTSPYIFKWSDNASPGHWKELESQYPNSTLELTYDSKVYEAADYSMTVIVYGYMGIFREKIAKASIDFMITDELNGFIKVNGTNNGFRPKRPKYTPLQPLLISTEWDTAYTAEIYDPTDYLAGAKLQYFWFLNDTNYGMSENATFPYKMPVGKANVEATVLAYMPDYTDVTEILQNSTFLKSTKKAKDQNVRTWMVENEFFKKPRKLNSSSVNTVAIIPSGPPPEVKFGIFEVYIEAKAPLKNFTIEGKTWLKHGAILNLTLHCDGSGPWSYCWNIVENNFNITGNETCKNPIVLDGNCSIPVEWYFRTNGTYNIFVIMNNGVGTVRRIIHVTSYQVPRADPVSIVIVPLVSAIMCVLAAVSGIFVYLSWKQSIAIEVADFDFSPQEEQELECKNFIERLRESWKLQFNHATDSISHVSSVSSRSAQPPGVGIHYGSIQ